MATKEVQTACASDNIGMITNRGKERCKPTILGINAEAQACTLTGDGESMKFLGIYSVPLLWPYK